MAHFRTRPSSYTADYTALPTEDLLALYRQNLDSRLARRDLDVGAVLFDWDSERDAAEAESDERRTSEERALEQELWPGDHYASPRHGSRAAVRDEAIQVDFHTKKSKKHAPPRQRVPLDSDIGADWVMVDVTEREGDLSDEEDGLSVVRTGARSPVEDMLANPRKAVPSKRRGARRKTKPTEKPPYGWASHPLDDGVHKTTFNLRASANIDLSSLRAGVRAGLLPRTLDDAEVHEHAHMHAHPHPHDHEKDDAVLAWVDSHASHAPPPVPAAVQRPAATHAAPAPIASATQPPVRLEYEQRLVVPRLGLRPAADYAKPKGRKAKNHKHTAAARRDEVSAPVADAGPRPSTAASVTGRLGDVLSTEALERRGEWRTEYTDYFGGVGAPGAVRPDGRGVVFGAHTPAAPARAVVRHHRDLLPPKDILSRSVHVKDVDEDVFAVVHHPKPWTGTSPGLWKAGATHPLHPTAHAHAHATHAMSGGGGGGGGGGAGGEGGGNGGYGGDGGRGGGGGGGGLRAAEVSAPRDQPRAGPPQSDYRPRPPVHRVPPPMPDAQRVSQYASPFFSRLDAMEREDAGRPRERLSLSRGGGGGGGGGVGGYDGDAPARYTVSAR